MQTGIHVCALNTIQAPTVRMKQIDVITGSGVEMVELAFFLAERRDVFAVLDLREGNVKPTLMTVKAILV
jgi:hypothetical protein